MISMDDQLPSLLARVRPKADFLFASFRIPRHDTEDLFQEALLSLVRCWTTVRTPDTWLVQAVRHLCYRYLEQERYRPAPIERMDPNELIALEEEGRLQGLSLTLSSPQELWDLRMDLEALIADLPPLNRRVLRMWFMEGLGDVEGAKKIGFKRRSVRQNVRRSVKDLKEMTACRLIYRVRSGKPRQVRRPRRKAPKTAEELNDSTE